MTRKAGNFQVQGELVLENELEQFTRKALEEAGSNVYVQCVSRLLISKEAGKR
jgi:hypothetical protein